MYNGPKENICFPYLLSLSSSLAPWTHCGEFFLCKQRCAQLIKWPHLLRVDWLITWKYTTHPWPFSKSKFNLKSDRVNIVAPASPIECLFYLTNVRPIQYKLGPERLGNSNVLQLLVIHLFATVWLENPFRATRVGRSESMYPI